MSRQLPRGRRVALPPPERVARGLRARLNLTALLAVLLPALTVGALSLVRAPAAGHITSPPTQSSLNLATVTCPSATGRSGRSGHVVVASAGGRSGSVDATPTGSTSSTTVDVQPNRPATADVGKGPVVVRGVDEMAPGLLASRLDAGPAAVSCTVPRPDQWFTGLGAAARHSSVIELVNPDPGSADADITFLSARGPVDAPNLRGITVPGGRSLRIDLSKEIPQRGELAAHVVVTRGRLGVYAADSFDQLGNGASGVDWVAPQQPATTATMLGVPAGSGSRSLVLGNDGADEVRVVVRVVTKDSVFRPEGLDEVRVPPGSTKRVSLTGILAKAVNDGAVGVEVEATHPVTATLRSFVAGDVSHAVPLDLVEASTEVIVPAGRSRVLLSPAEAGSATVVARLAGGGKKAVDVDLTPGQTTMVDLPAKTVLVQVVPARTSVRGAVVVTQGGTAIVALRELVTTSLVPAVRPALP